MFKVQNICCQLLRTDHRYVGSATPQRGPQGPARWPENSSICVNTSFPCAGSYIPTVQKFSNFIVRISRPRGPCVSCVVDEAAISSSQVDPSGLQASPSCSFHQLQTVQSYTHIPPMPQQWPPDWRSSAAA